MVLEGVMGNILCCVYGVGIIMWNLSTQPSDRPSLNVSLELFTKIKCYGLYSCDTPF